MTSADTSEVYVIRPDGSGERCVTCDTPHLPKGIRGQPAWHPDGRFLVIQVQGKFYRGSRFEFVAWGIHNDLWLVAADGSWAQQLLKTEYLGASLHPHFSDTGDRLFWSVRKSTGMENPWDGWHLAIANFARGNSGRAKLTNRVDLYRGQGGFFESHDLKKDVMGKEIAVYYATFDGGLITQKIDILRLDRNY